MWESGIVAVAVVAVAGLAVHLMALPEPVAKTVTGVFYVPACGNGPLELDGATWYPMTLADLRADPPTPGSGQGEITIYSDGRAHWLSGGGLYPTWLTTTPQDYSKMCS